MAKVTFDKIKIKGISTVVGDKCINIDDEKEYYSSEKQLERLKKSIGFNSRYVVSQDITADKY